MESRREIAWDLSKTHTFAALRGEPSESDPSYNIYCGLVRIKLRLPGDRKLAEDSSRIVAWITDGEISSIYIDKPADTLEGVFRRGLGLIKKYDGPPEAFEEFREWHREVAAEERNQAFRKLWDREKHAIGIEVRHSFQESKPWYLSVAVSFPEHLK